MQQFQEIIDVLKSAELQACNENRDGRTNSIIDEDTIINYLAEHPKFKGKIIGSDQRKFCDFYYFKNKEHYYFNIKTTNAKAPDNAFNKQGLLFAFTDLPIDKIPLNKVYANKFIDLILDNKKVTTRDYYYLVVHKKKFPENVIIRGIKQINFDNFNFNPTNNMQIYWNREFLINPSDNNFEDAFQRIIVDGVFEAFERQAALYNRALAYRKSKTS